MTATNEPEIAPAHFPDERTLALWIAYSFVCHLKGLQNLQDANVDEYIKLIGEYRDKLVGPPGNKP